MGPALDRLLARPSALRLLRCATVDNTVFACISQQCHSQSTLSRASTHRTTAAASTCRHYHHHHHNHHHPQRLQSLPRRGLHTWPQPGNTEPRREDGSSLAVLISLYTGAPLFDKIGQGQHPFDMLLYEADVAAAPDTGRGRLVDQPEHMHNMELWLELLRFRKRLHGPKGIQEVWHGMMRRNVDLPVNGPTADALWSIFISSIFAEPSFLDHICRHAKHLSQSAAKHRPNLYQAIVGTCLRTLPGFAVDWHDRMHEHGLVPPGAAASVVDHALRSRNRKMAFKMYKKIYKQTSASGIYDLCISSICDSCDLHTAILWHRFLVEQNDLPSSTVQSRPIVQLLFAATESGLSKPREVNAAQQKYAALQRQPLVDPEQPVLSRSSMNALVGDVHGIRQKRLGDAFCARLFATGAFSIDLVITGLRMLGLESLGSLALREIAARAERPSDYLSSIRSLETAGIHIVDSTFSRVLKMFAENNNEASFAVIVGSDQHPDSYEDFELQEKLFKVFTQAGKTLEANTTLAILNLSQSDQNYYTMNLLLQTYSKTLDREHVTQTLNQMRLRRIPIKESSLRVIFFYFLRPRRKGRKPVVTRGYARDLDFVSNVFLMTLRAGQDFDQTMWRELLKRYGLTNRFRALERLCLWIAMWHSVKLKGQMNSHSTSSEWPHQRRDDLESLESHQPFGVPSPLEDVFSGPLLRAIVAWGFISAAPPLNHEREFRVTLPQLPSSPFPYAAPSDIVPERWARGIALVRKLQDLGVDITYARVQREAKLRLWILFGPGKSTVPRNRLAREQNSLSLLHYVRHINEVWQGNFFMLPEGCLDESPHAEARLYGALFGHHKRKRIHGHVRSAIADMNDIPQALHDSTVQHASHSLHD